MNAKEAREIIARGPNLKLDNAMITFEELSRQVTNNNHSYGMATGYLEGLNSKETLERPEVKSLVEACQQAIQVFKFALPEAQSTLTIEKLEQALAHYREAVGK